MNPDWLSEQLSEEDLAVDAGIDNSDWTKTRRFDIHGLTEEQVKALLGIEQSVPEDIRNQRLVWLSQLPWAGVAPDWLKREWAVEKANPYHDEKGRFTSAGKAVAAGRRKSANKGKRARKTKDIGDQEFDVSAPFGRKTVTLPLRDIIADYTQTMSSVDLLSHIASKKPHRSAKPLYRGMVLSQLEFDDFVAQLKVGKSIKVGGSWTESQGIARDFANKDKSPTMFGAGDYSVVVTVKSGARGLHVAPYAAPEWKYQREWILPDTRIKIVSFKRVGKRVYVEMAQQ
jgi:hypothetical protein